MIVAWLLCLASQVPAAEALVNAGQAIPEVRVFDGANHPTIQHLAEQHAAHMAEQNQGGHQNWDKRFQFLLHSFQRPPYEICAQSWPWEKNHSPDQIARSLFRAWRASPGHWRTATRSSKYWGAAVARNANGIWYGCVIAVFDDPVQASPACPDCPAIERDRQQGFWPKLLKRLTGGDCADRVQTNAIAWFWEQLRWPLLVVLGAAATMLCAAWILRHHRG